MKVENINLHGLSLEEAIEKTHKNLEWCKKNNIDVIVLNHGKGLHSKNNFSVIKKEIRKMLKEENSNHDYKIVYGESNLPIALGYNEGNTLLVQKGLENQTIGGRIQQEKNHILYSEEGKKFRKIQKKLRAEKRRRY